MLTISDGEITLTEFLDTDKNDEFSTYISWVRDIKNMEMIDRREYLLSMNEQNIYDYVRVLNDSECDSFFKYI